MVHQVPELPGSVLVDKESVHYDPLIGANTDHVISMEDLR